MTADNKPTSAYALTDDDYQRFQQLARRMAGLAFPGSRRPELERAVLESCTVTGHTTPGRLFSALEQANDGDPVQTTFLHYVTVGETYFFRNEPQFRALAEHILPELIRRRRPLRQLRIWSAGCATGEEPYSLAILLERLLPDLERWQVLILATDINRTALERARAGVYGAWSFRQTPPEIQAMYFRPQGRSFVLDERLRQRVTFAYLNLSSAGYPAMSNNTMHMDLILCRNVLIYLAPPTVRQVVERLHGALSEDGWLVVGHAEPSQEVFSRFTTCNFPDTVVYRKPAGSGNEAPQPLAVEGSPTPAWAGNDPQQRHSHLPIWEQWPPMLSGEPAHLSGMLPPPPAQLTHTTHDHPVAPPAAQQRAPGAETTPALAAALQLAAQGQVEAALEMLTCLAGAPANDALAAYHLASLYAGRGQWGEAERWVQVAIEHRPFLPEAHYLYGLLLQEAGQPVAAITALRRAIYADLGFVMAHFTLAQVYALVGETKRATREWATVVDLLACRAEQEILPGSDGLSAGRLRAVTRRHLLTATADH